MIAGAGVMAVPDAHLLLTMGWAHARIHVEHDAPWRAAAVHEVDPLAGQVGKSREVRTCREPIWLGDAARPCAALPPTIQRMAGSWRRRSASFTSSYPARR